MAAHLIQVKVEPVLKEKLQRIALSKGLNVTAYIKMTLFDVCARDDELALTENGFTAKEEKRILKSIKEGEKEYSENGSKEKHSSMNSVLNSLNA